MNVMYTSRPRHMVINNCAEFGTNFTNYNVRHNGFSSSETPQTYNNSWHVRESATYGSGSVRFKEGPCTCSSWPKCEHAAAMRYNNGSQSAASMVASYGVYKDAGLRLPEDEDGFQPRANHYRGVVVNAAGSSSVVRPAGAAPAAARPEVACCGWCGKSQTGSATQEPSCWFSWCRPTVLLVVLIVLVIVFVSVSGILLYYNCMFRCCACRCRSVGLMSIFVCDGLLLVPMITTHSSSQNFNFFIIIFS